MSHVIKPEAPYMEKSHETQSQANQTQKDKIRKKN
jgi:hypothetical protein